MEQKTIWMRYLPIGINIIMIFFIIGCNKGEVDRTMTVSYIYKNESGKDLVMKIYNRKKMLFKEFSIPNNDEVETNTTTSQTPAIFYFSSFEDKIGDSVVIRFIDDKCLHYKKNGVDRIFEGTEYDNYSDELMKLSSFTLYYIISETDYDTATDCN